ncbi:hypothetical protein BVC71_07880 [Marivivens niveibacter]|uniref:Uncharacterized protein n=1 Tax=Marivivens niveibacter TaxID=1930667 RepID=A0A251WZK7_9RHOB|nr:hypothetical protein [Marivivens niveibacter]OUD09741.1 hypothetical protein BVC71_07880 [Marivivens niveibacter]
MSDLSNTPHTPRGGAPVGKMADLDPVEAAAVLYFRMWCDGANGADRLRMDFLSTLGIDQGEAALGAFNELCQSCTTYGRRPLMRHSLTCSCLGADESCFANLVALAGEGAREDAALIASLIVRADLALPMADLAQQVGIAFRRMMMSADLNTPPTLH